MIVECKGCWNPATDGEWCDECTKKRAIGDVVPKHLAAIKSALLRSFGHKGAL